MVTLEQLKGLFNSEEEDKRILAIKLLANSEYSVYKFLGGFVDYTDNINRHISQGISPYSLHIFFLSDYAIVIINNLSWDIDLGKNVTETEDQEIKLALREFFFIGREKQKQDERSINI